MTNTGRRLIINTFSGRNTAVNAVRLPPAENLSSQNARIITSLANAYRAYAEEEIPDHISVLPRGLYSTALLSPGSDDKIFFIYPQRDEPARFAGLYKKVLSRAGLDAEFKGYNTARDDDSQSSMEVTIKNALSGILETALKPDHLWNYSVIINGTGGPEELLPYLSMIWAIFSIPLYYLPPGEHRLIRLPSSTLINFDTDLIKLHETRFSELQSEHLMDEEKFLIGLSPGEVSRLSPLLSKFGNKVSLSPLGFILWKKYWLENPPPLPHSERIPLDKDHLGEVDNELFRTPGFSRFRERLGWNDLVEDFWYVRECDPGEARIEVGDQDFLIYYCGVILKVRVTAAHPGHFIETKKELSRLLER